MEEKYTIKDFVKDVGLNILGEIGGDAVELALGKIKDYFKSAKDRKAVYEKFCKLYNAENSEVKAYLDAVGDANKPKKSEKNINKFFSEFYTVLGVNREQIKNDLKDDENFSRLSDNSQNAIVDMVNEIRSYYYYFKFPVNDTDKLAAINLLLFRMDENSGKVDKRLDDIDSKLNLLIQRVGSVASDKDGNVTLGAVAHFAEREYHIIACPDCGSHDDAFVEAYMTGKQNGKVSCPACGNTVDYEDVSSKYEQQLTAIYAEINTLKQQLKDVTPQQIADKVFELAGNYFDDKVVVSEQTLAKYLSDNAAEIIDSLKNVFNEHDFEQAENIRKLLLAEMQKPYINKNQIYSYASDLCKVTGFSDDFFAKLCLNISRDNPDHKQLAQDIYSICRDSNYTKNYGAVLINYMLYKDFRLVNKTTRNSFGVLIERTYDGDDNDSLKKRKSSTQKVNDLIQKENKKTVARIKGVFGTKTHRDIFLIYSSKDIVEAARLCDYLESQCITDKNTGRQKLITCFFSLRNMDNDHEETDYKLRIEEAIEYCRAVLFIRSSNSLSSDCDAVYNEAKRFGEIDYVRQCDIENLKEEYHDIYEKWKKNEIEYVDIPRYCKKPRIQYVLDEGYDPEDELNYTTVNEFFGTDTACYPHDDSHIVKSYQKLVIDKEWWADPEPKEPPKPKEPTEGGSNPPPPPEPKKLTEAEFVGKKMCAKDGCGKLCELKDKFCTKCGCNVFYLTYEDYRRSLVKYCNFCGTENSKDDNFCSQCGSFEFVGYEEHMRMEEKKRNAILNIGDYKDIGGGYITFGTYPQSKKADNVKIGEIFDKERGYYLGSDDCMYAKYNLEYYKVEPIKWKVLQSGSEIFVVADDILDAHRFADSSNNYAYSDVRKFINGDFYCEAFNDSQKAKIITTTIDNSLSSTGDSKNKYTCSDTNDKVFLLSRKEAGQYITNDEARKRVPTDYALARGAWQSSDYKRNGKGCGMWWLRSPDSDLSDIAQYVNYAGSFYYLSVGFTNRGVVPALKFKP